ECVAAKADLGDFGVDWEIRPMDQRDNSSTKARLTVRIEHNTLEQIERVAEAAHEREPSGARDPRGRFMPNRQRCDGINRRNEMPSIAKTGITRSSTLMSPFGGKADISGRAFMSAFERMPTKRAIRALPINLSSRISELAEQARPCLLRSRALVNRLFYQRERRLFVKLREP